MYDVNSRSQFFFFKPLFCSKSMSAKLTTNVEKYVKFLYLPKKQHFVVF